MFNFKNLILIFDTNWKNVLNQISPKGNTYKIDNTVRDNLVTGFILVCGASLIEIFLGSSILLCFIKLVLSIAAIVLIDKFKDKEINTKHAYTAFIVVALLMLFDLLLSVMYLITCGGDFLKVLSTLVYMVETVGFAFAVIATITFCDDARKIYEAENKAEEEEPDIVLTTIDVNDVALHGDVACPKCGNVLSVNSLFCSNCGNKLK